MVSFLWLCHTGAVTCSAQEATAIREAAVMLGIHLNLEQQQARGQEKREDMQRAFPSIGVHKRKYENDAESSKKKLRLDRATVADPVAGQVEMARWALGIFICI